MDVYYVYLLMCWKDATSMALQRPLYGHLIYCGQTNNIFRRLKEHITGKSFYTKQFKGNIKLGYLEAYETRAEAMKREDEIKKYSRNKKVKMILSFQKNFKKELEFIEKNLLSLLSHSRGS